jgi:pimeloyl-ACP methyl ester carboxylesterase
MIPLPNNFTWALARHLSRYANLAYDQATITDAGTDARSLVTVDENGDIIVAFRGSSSPKDFIQDAKFAMEKLIVLNNGKEAYVHRGFLEDFNAISVAVVSNVKTLLAMHPLAKIYITGHSLGGALAILCALEFARQKLPVAGVITFGQPRVGDANFAALYDATYSNRDEEVVIETEGEEDDHVMCSLHLRDITFRVVNQNDIVPRTPGWLMGYRHCGQEIFLSPLGCTLINPSLWIKIVCDAIGLYGAYRNREDVLIREHFMAAYQDRIQNL